MRRVRTLLARLMGKRRNYTFDTTHSPGKGR